MPSFFLSFLAHENMFPEVLYEQNSKLFLKDAVCSKQMCVQPLNTKSIYHGLKTIGTQIIPVIMCINDYSYENS